VAGQNVGARKPDRVKHTFRVAAAMAAGGMLLLAVGIQFAAPAAIRIFSADPDAIAVGVEYLRIVSISFVPSGIVFVSSSMFQAMGNTIPSLLSSFTRIVIVAIPTLMLSRLPGFELRWVWYVSVGTVIIQMMLSLGLLRREYGRRLAPDLEPASRL
jgi:Na+-driven multidrug efflux pump